MLLLFCRKIIRMLWYGVSSCYAVVTSYCFNARMPESMPERPRTRGRAPRFLVSYICILQCGQVPVKAMRVHQNGLGVIGWAAPYFAGGGYWSIPGEPAISSKWQLHSTLAISLNFAGY